MGYGIYSMMMLMFAMSPSNEMLDYVDTDAYWKSKEVVVSVESMIAELDEKKAPGNVDALIRQLGDDDFDKREAAQKELTAMGPAALPKVKEATRSDDLEVATRAQAIVRDLSSGGAAAPAIRRLMAIRTLGELKDAKSIAVLTGLLKSEVPFEAEYAGVAIASIRDQGYTTRTLTNDELRKEVWLLPKDCGTVIQARLNRESVIKIAELLDKFAPEHVDAEEKAEIAQDLTEGFVSLAEMIGNFRVDGVTIGASADIGDDHGFIIMIFRGKYDKDALLSVLKNPAGDAERLVTTRVQDKEVLTPRHGSQMSLILDSDERLVLLAGPVDEPEELLDKLPIKEVVTGLKTGEAGLRQNAEMVKLINSVPLTASGLAVMKVTPSYEEAEVLNGFDTLVLSTSNAKHGLDWKLTAVVKDKDDAANALETFKGLQEELLEEMEDADDEMKFVAEALTKVIKGIKIDQTPETITLTTVTDNAMPNRLMMMLFSEIIGPISSMAYQAN